jgi:hypothetical protein
MTQDEIMKMAREAGLHIATDVNWMPIISLGNAERFANLVAQHEREACAKLCDDLDKMRGYSYADKCAKAIRARGQA